MNKYLEKVAMMSPALKGIARKASGAVSNTASASQAIGRLQEAKKLGTAVQGMGKPINALEKMDLSHNPALQKGHVFPEKNVKDALNLHKRTVASGAGSLHTQAHAETVGLRHGRILAARSQRLAGLK